MKKYFLFIVMLAICNMAIGQWNSNGINIYNTNTGYVGIGNNAPTTLLHVQKNVTEPTITVQNLGGFGGATYSMIDNASGAYWKFKATLNGGFKIRDHANGIDVFIIEQNTSPNLLYLKSGGNVGIGTAAPASSSLLDLTSNSKGFLPPRMTSAEMNAIANPANGLLVYCTDCASDGLGRISIFMAGSWYTLSVNNCTSPPAVPTEGNHLGLESQIIWSWNSVTGATGYKWNTANNYFSAIDIGNITSKTESGLQCNTVFTRYVWAYNGCGNSPSTILTQATSIHIFECGDSLTINHLIGTVSPVNKSVTYGTINNVPGEPNKCWITSNLGSNHQSTSFDDTSEESAGWYWQFNRQQGYMHDGETRTPGTPWIDPIDEQSNWQEGNDPCTIELGENWRIPTINEWANVREAGWWINGYDPWYSLLKLHDAGCLEPSYGELNMRGSAGKYWSSIGLESTVGQFFYFQGLDCWGGGEYKSFGLTIRCIRN